MPIFPEANAHFPEANAHFPVANANFPGGKCPFSRWQMQVFPVAYGHLANAHFSGLTVAAWPCPSYRSDEGIWEARIPKTSTRSDEEILEATIPEDKH